MITHKQVLDLFDYKETGHLVWRINSTRIHAGQIAGHIDASGYTTINIKGKSYLAHRLIWLWHNGYMPEEVLDHIDKTKTNKIENLREVSRTCNQRNTNNPKHNSSGVKGVSFDTNRGKWASYIQVAGTTVHLGRHDDFTEAVAHRLAGEQLLGWDGCDETSPAFLYMLKYVGKL